MKTLELNLKKKVLIVDAINEKEAFDAIFEIFNTKNISDYKFLCKGSELTEEIASELVEMEYSGLYKKNFYIDYDRPSLLLKFAKESFISAVESKGFYWIKNPIEKPIEDDYNLGDIHSGFFRTKLNQWQEIEEKTLRNPLIFVKNYEK